MSNYIETDCTFTHEGRTVESGGAVVTPDFAIGYLRNLQGQPWSLQSGEITNWHGQVLGQVTRFRTWETRHYGYMYQITARINGVLYTGRTTGNGMIWKGKRVAQQ